MIKKGRGSVLESQEGKRGKVKGRTRKRAVGVRGGEGSGLNVWGEGRKDYIRG